MRDKGLRIRHLAIACMVAAAMGLSAAESVAVPISFTFSATGSGSIGESSFVGAGFVITATGDTDTRQALANGYRIENTTVAISITGLGSYQFLSGTGYSVFANNGLGLIGFGLSGGADLITGPGDGSLRAWDMLTSIGPISGFATFQEAWGTSSVNTSGGRLIFNPGASSASFQATVVPATVPEPGTILLIGLGLIGVAGARRLRN